MNLKLPIIILLLVASVRIAFACSYSQNKLICTKAPTRSNNNSLRNLRNTIINKAENTVYHNLNQVEGNLVMGMVIGVDNFNNTKEFKGILKRSGTIHVVVVSGFNITLVYNFMLKVLKGTKKYSFGLSTIFVLFYCFIVGFSPPVVRAVIMSTIFVYAKKIGRKTITEYIFAITLLISLIIKPEYITSLSFQLSFLATYGLIAFAEQIKTYVNKYVKAEIVFVDDFSATVAAQILVIPILTYKFGSISLVSFVANTLVLWTVPLITILGFVLIIFGSISSIIHQASSAILHFLLTYFINLLEYFSKFKYAQVEVQINFYQMMFCYILIFSYVFYKNNMLKPKTTESDKIRNT